MCEFPFIYEGKNHYKCLDSTTYEGMKWCGVTDNYDQDQRLGYCENESEYETTICVIT